MKLRIRNKGKGWYILATNYKDKEDYTFVNVYFTQQCGEPEFVPNQDGVCIIDILAKEGWHTSYKKKAGITIKDYELLSNIDLNEHPTDDTGMFGNPNNVIESDDLPFY